MAATFEFLTSRFGLTKYNNIGTFEQNVRPKLPSGKCKVNCFLTDRTALNTTCF